MGLGNRAKDKMLENLIPDVDTKKNKTGRKYYRSINEQTNNIQTEMQAKAFIQKNWKLPVELACRLRKYVQEQKANNPETTEIKIITELLDNHLRARGF